MAEPVSIIDIGRSLNDVEKPAVLKGGKYEGEVVNVELGQSAKGNQYFAIQIIIPPDSFPADQRDELEGSYPDGLTLTYNRVIVPRGPNDGRALYNVKRLYIALGLTPPDDGIIDPNEWMGRPVTVQTRTSVWEGEERAEIQSLIASSRADEDEAPAKPAARGRARR